MLLTRDGQVYTWGGNSSGQLELGDIQYRKTPQKVNSLKNTKITAIAVGDFHTLALTQFGIVYLFAKNARDFSHEMNWQKFCLCSLIVGEKL